MGELINNFLEPLSPVIPLVLLLFYFRRVAGIPELRMLLILYGSLFLLNGTAAMLAYYDTVNIWVYDLTGITAFVLIFLYFTYVFKKKVLKKSVYILLPVFFVFYMGYTYLLTDNRIFNSLGFALIAILISCYCILFYVESIQKEERNLTGVYSFWIITSFFIYYLGSFFIFLSYKAMTAQGIKTGILWGLHNIIYFVSCCIAAYGIWKASQKNFTLLQV